MLKMENKESVEVLAQKDCSTRRDPNGIFTACRTDCLDPDERAWFACDFNRRY